jgi:molecular chaperone GrpE (heat shock protein)
MSNQLEPKLSKWPFLTGDGLLLVTAWFLYSRSALPLGAWQIAFIVFCVAAGACLTIVPFVLEHRALVKLAEANSLTTVVAQVQKLETIGAEISNATGRWQFVQEAADKTAAGAKSLSEQMQAHLQGFTEFMQRANESEKATLRLEVEKLRRAEADWLQVLVRTLDHIHALHSAGVRSGQANVVEQLTQFQYACHDAARRVGLTPFAAEPSEPFDRQKHQVMGGNGEPPKDAIVAETLAAGYTFQGRLIRPALVRLKENQVEAGAPNVTSGQHIASAQQPDLLPGNPGDVPNPG